MITVYPMQLVALKDHLLLVNEFNHVVRHIWTDKTERDEDPTPKWYGDGVVRWEGDVMVVDSVNFVAKNYLDPAGDLYSPKMRDHRALVGTADPGSSWPSSSPSTDPETYTKPGRRPRPTTEWIGSSGEFAQENNRTAIPTIRATTRAFTLDQGPGPALATTARPTAPAAQK